VNSARFSYSITHKNRSVMLLLYVRLICLCRSIERRLAPSNWSWLYIRLPPVYAYEYPTYLYPFTGKYMWDFVELWML